VAYRLKYIHAAIANKTIIAIQRDESLIPVFLAMNHILSPTSRLRATIPTRGTDGFPLPHAQQDRGGGVIGGTTVYRAQP